MNNNYYWVASLVWRHLSNTASFVLCVFRRVKDHHILKHYSRRLKKTCAIRQVVLDKCFPLKLAVCMFACVATACTARVCLTAWHQKTATRDIWVLAPPNERGTKGVPRRGVWTSVDMRVWTCNELRVKHDQTSCYLQPPFLGTPLVPSRVLSHSLTSEGCDTWRRGSGTPNLPTKSVPTKIIPPKSRILVQRISM